ncbi:MAG TPA: PD-(D/E)XK nuclease family protein, partial [Candidatus Kapabacteria bacterium]|nr:PD-(D/E)XK nuclease family protein [Candidatus Kapabacteria bacterium]
MDGYIADLEEQLASRFDDPMIERALRTELEELKQASNDTVVIEALTEELGKKRTPHEFIASLKQNLTELETLRLLFSESSITSADNLELETRSYKMFIELLDELLSITETLGLSKHKLATGFYLERLRIAATRARFSIRAEPQSAVVITSFDQIIGNEFEHLFLVGLREGLFPLGYKRSLFTPDEYVKTHNDHLIEQRYLFYQTLCTSRKKIYLSWHTGSQDGTKKYGKSSVVSSLEELFVIPPSIDDERLLLSPSEFYRSSAKSHDWTSASDIAIATDMARTAGLDEPSLARLRDIQPSMITMERTRRSRPGTIYAGILPTDDLSDAELERLAAYRESVYSVSQLETYAACGFKFFSRYLLGISAGEREVEEGLDASEQGTMLHETLYKLLERCTERGLNLRELGPNANTIAREVIGELYPEKNIAKLHPFARLDRERLFEARSSAGSLLERFIAAEQTDEMRRILAQPRFFELVFGHKNVPQREGYPDNSKPVEIGGVKFRGKIDRVDMDEQGRFLVVDYKSGSSASMKDMELGYSLQLPLYLRIAEDLFRAHLGSDVQGVAALYHKLKYAEEKREFRIVLTEAMKDGVFEQTRIQRKFESPEALANFIEMVVGYAKSYVEGIASGRFPLVTEERRSISCRVCEYSSVCRVAQAEADGVLA